jgi:phage-related protein
MPAIARGCHELGVRDRNQDWRIVYHITPEAVVILDVFAKKTATTPKLVIEGCRKRLAEFQRLMLSEET